jgi:cyclohexanone monooxygenase
VTPENDVDGVIDAAALESKYEEERRKRLRQDGTRQYEELKGRLADFDQDPHADPNFTREPAAGDTDVVIIGGGFAGLLAGARLRQAGIQGIRFIDKAGDFGGTWYWNRYPGIACDVESYIYMPLLEELGYIPTEKYASGPEIFSYCKKLAEHYQLYSGALFQTEVTTLRWSEQRKRWIVSTTRNDQIAARFVVCCTGLLSKPKLPGIPGLETFAGRSFHTSRWDYAYTGGDHRGGLGKLADKNVGIIGTGATAVQCIPHLAGSVKHLYVFQRTPSSIDVRNNGPTDPAWAGTLQPGWQRRRMDNFTLNTSGVFQAEDLVNDGWTEIARHCAPPIGGEAPADPAALQLAEMRKMEQVRKRVTDTVADKATAEALKPYYHYFCKRPCFHDEYLAAFNKPNVTLVDTAGLGVERITPTGVIVGGKEYPLDCLIFATGFDFMREFTRESGLDITGRGAVSLSQHWAEGARTLYGMQTRGFPNFFLMSLVQSGIGINYMQIAEAQTRHIAYVITECLARGGKTIEPSQEAENAWVAEIVARNGPRRAFLEACTPGYFNYEGARPRSVELNEPYAGGAIAYLKILEDQRAAGALQGLEMDGESPGVNARSMTAEKVARDGKVAGSG